MKHSTRCFIRYPYTSKSVLKNSATLRFSTHFSVSEYQISTQLNRNKFWFSSQGQHLLRQAVGVFQKRVIFRWIYTKSIFVNCTFTSLILRRPTSFTRTTSDVWESGCTFASNMSFSGWKTTFTLKTPSCFTPPTSFLQLQFNMGIMQAKCKMSTVLEIKTIAHTFLARNKKVKVKK